MAAGGHGRPYLGTKIGISQLLGYITNNRILPTHAHTLTPGHKNANSGPKPVPEPFCPK